MERIISTNLLVPRSLAVKEERRSNNAGNCHIHGVDCGGGGVSSSQIGCSTAIPVLNHAGFGCFEEDPTFFPQNHRAAFDPLPRLRSPKPEPGGNEIQSMISRRHDQKDLYHLPDLRSLEPAYRSLNPPLHPSDDLMSLIQSSQKRFRPSPLSSLPPPPPPPPLPAPPPCYDFQAGFGKSNPASRPEMPTSELARRRRKRISDRTRILEGLMPWEKRMDTGAMLSEAQKYIKFLEAQVTALQSMPCASAWSPLPLAAGGVSAAMGCGLEKLSRQQLLQVMMSSPLVQDMLYKREWCVFSAEQVAALRQEVERRPQLMVLLGSAAPK